MYFVFVLFCVFCIQRRSKIHQNASSRPQALVVFAVIRVVTALFIKETLASAANDAEMVIEESRRMAVEYQERLEVGATCWDVDDVRPTPFFNRRLSQ